MNKSLLFAVCLCTTFNVSAQGAQQAKLKDNAGGWPVWGGDAGGTRFSPLRDITKANVDTLQVAWEYHTGDSSEHKPGTPPSSFLATPVLHDNTLYFCSGLSRAFAVDAETGEERWVFDSKPRIDSPWTAKCRGVALWQDRVAQDRAAQDRRASRQAQARQRIAARCHTAVPDARVHGYAGRQAGGDRRPHRRRLRGFRHAWRSRPDRWHG
ncbi:MAG: PQQ-binding-like beta-propeller repeat protein [Haliea sp.]|nr:PQQ-binding-like beta-propeller repeat protein [Haliea sp.]